MIFLSPSLVPAIKPHASSGRFSFAWAKIFHSLLFHGKHNIFLLFKEQIAYKVCFAEAICVGDIAYAIPHVEQFAYKSPLRGDELRRKCILRCISMIWALYLLVINQFCDGRMIATDGTLMICLWQFDRVEFHL